MELDLKKQLMLNEVHAKQEEVILSTMAAAICGGLVLAKSADTGGDEMDELADMATELAVRIRRRVKSHVRNGPTNGSG